MTARARHTAFAVLLALSAAVAGTAAATAADAAPDVQTQAPAAITTASAALPRPRQPAHQDDHLLVRVGTTLAYGTATNPASAGKGDKPVTVTVGIGVARAGTTYHLRLVASNDRGVRTARRDLRDARRDGAGPARALADPRRAVAAAGHRARARARRGPPSSGAAWRSRPPNGSVLVRVPGRHPAGVALRRRLDSGRLHRRHARRQREAAGRPPRRSHPDRHLPRRALRGAPARRRPRHDRARAARRAAHVPGRRRPRRRGRTRPPAARRSGATIATASFRTRASNSVITVRGTTWYVADRCDGTLTRVTSGSVSVRDLRRQRTVVVRAGHSYLARPTG